MAKYLLLKHYRGGPAAVNEVPMDQWTPEEFSAHKQDPARLRRYLDEFAATMPRTALRYAVEHLDPAERQRYVGMKARTAEARQP